MIVPTVRNLSSIYVSTLEIERCWTSCSLLSPGIFSSGSCMSDKVFALIHSVHHERVPEHLQFQTLHPLAQANTTRLSNVTWSGCLSHVDSILNSPSALVTNQYFCIVRHEVCCDP